MTNPNMTMTIILFVFLFANVATANIHHQQRSSIVSTNPIVAKSSQWQGIATTSNQSTTLSSSSSSQQQQQQPQRVQTTTATTNSNEQWIGNGHLQFTFDLLAGIFMNSIDLKTGNLDSVVFSPFSIQSMLMMIHLGAKGVTKSEIAKILHLDSMENNVTFSKTHEAFSQAVKSLIDDVNISKSLHSANQIFIQETLQVSNTYLSAVNHYHLSSIRYLNFAKESYQVLNTINDWIEKQTQHMITNFLTTPPSPATTLMAVNAIRFKGDWQYRFDPSDTEKDAWFRMINGQVATVDMMVAQHPVAFAYSASLQTSIIELPFKMQRLSFFLLLPNDTFGLFSLLNSLNATVFADLIYSMRKVNSGDKTFGGSNGVNIRLPKFTISSMPRITEIMKTQMGVKSLFSTESANLEAMFNRYSGHIHMGDLLHKAVIKIDEQGSIGAAVSTSSIERIGAFNGPYFEADHPFIYLLMDKQTGLALFAGIYAGPGKEDQQQDSTIQKSKTLSTTKTIMQSNNNNNNLQQQINTVKNSNQQPPSSASIQSQSSSYHHHHHHQRLHLNQYTFGMTPDGSNVDNNNKMKYKL
ncbi:leukocyte elastase inhibitor [Dermatophagoides farinae]|uniref:Sar s 27 allergen n=1 Tax=Dermatophagoides farinae TaxID=6954 RepID=A0A9D4SGI1_DERFA|nr:leukocyte elastase inhibitor-like [Dermatophagoides farinae]KAH7640791.1 sar s 27 allergen [Dermatophagoides farinae]